MPAQDILKDLELLIRSRYGLIVLQTGEDDRAAALLRHLADSLRLPFFTWTCTRGLQRDGADNFIYMTDTASGALNHVQASQLAAIYHFQGMADELSDKIVAGKLKDAAEPLALNAGAIVITGEGVSLPENIKSMSATVRLPAPELEDYRSLLSRVMADLWSRSLVKSEMTAESTNQFLNALRGLTLMEAEKVITKVIVEDGKLSPSDIGEVIKSKKAIVEREGVLEYFPTDERMRDVADLVGLKAWLAERRAILTDPAAASKFGLGFPRGILLLGVPGCGKSLCAKAVAADWALPLLKLDPSNLYNKYVGESEKNFQRAIRTAERVAPVVLWIDELEKAFSYSSGGDDGGLSMRIFGTFLSWLQDRKGDVFVVATANDVTKLPPEFLRKGRFDEIFFVDLPDAEARRSLFSIHLGKRKQDPARFDLGTLAASSDGFSGAEVEQAVVAALYTAFTKQSKLSTEHVLDEVSRTRPLSQTMGEKIAWLRDWAKDRTRSAHV